MSKLATRIHNKLYVGAFPPAKLKDKGFDVVVLCAQEKQDVRPDIPTIRVPFDDGPLPNKDYQRAVKAAMAVTKLRKLGKRVLVTCHQGVNRSAFVAALSLMQLERLNANSAINLVRTARQPDVGSWRVLGNDDFEKALYHFEGLARGRATPWKR